MLIDILNNVIGVLIGGVITWYVSRRYYKKAGEELRTEAAGLRRLVEMERWKDFIALVATLREFEQQQNPNIQGPDLVGRGCRQFHTTRADRQLWSSSGGELNLFVIDPVLRLQGLGEEICHGS